MASKTLAGRYELIEKIGDGGMAVVYKAKDRLLNRFVAIKILKPEFVRDPKFIDSFRRESQAAARLSHANIVSVYDVGKEGNIYYIVMELLEGDTLSDVIRREGCLSEEYTIEIAKQMALALHAAHTNNIIHRDVKPHNILMTEDGTVKIADFGIARAVNSGTIVNNTSTVMGSVHYLSPEQARGGVVDARSDIYSLGIVMYEMLTGEVPFDGDNPVSVAMMHMNNEVPPPSRVNSHVSELMDNIVLKATAKHQPDRYKSAAELYEALVKAENTMSGENGHNSFYMIERDDRDTRDYYNDDDDEDSNSSRRKKDKKKEKEKKSRFRKALPVILALICAIPLSLLLINIFGSSGDSVEIPDVLGMTEEEAAQELEDVGLEYKLGTPVISDEYEEGQVADTDPDVGRKVKKGYTVTLILSRGTDTESVKVPNMVGKTLDEAEETLENFDLMMGEVEYDESSSLPEGTVVSHSPDAGEEVETGTAINFVVSKGGAKVQMPAITGMSQSDAESALEAAGLALGSVNTEYSDNVQEGLVIYAEYDAGTELDEGTSVSITLSKGSEPQAVEYVQIPLTINYSDADDEVFNLTVTVTNDDGSMQYIVNNQQREKSSGSEQVVLTGTGKNATVRVLMNNQIVEEYTANFETGELR